MYPPLVHLELHTGTLSRAAAFYTRLFGWHMERIDNERLPQRTSGGVRARAAP
jgi:predicted enzyme related to lactoylglutathione lyase